MVMCRRNLLDHALVEEQRAHGLGYEYVEGGHGQQLQLLYAAVDDVDGRRAAVAVNKALQGGGGGGGGGGA
jgi:hypothetical protein